MYNPAMKRLTALFSIIGLLHCPALAAAVEYDFELIIFEDTSGRYVNSEQWQHELRSAETGSLPSTQAPSRTTAANSKAANIRSIKGIGLEKYARKLKASSRYNVLAHKAWRQSGLDQKEAVDIPIDSRTDGVKTTQAGKGNNIHGSIRIVLARYLHIYTDLIYQQPRKEAAPAWYDQESRRYRQYPIKSHRRMRSKELHYLDHPMVGILVMAMPVEKQEQPSNDT